MNSQNSGELASDQKIENVFHAYGYSIPVAKDGRRLWPTKFKLEVGRRMRSGTLSIRDVGKTCRVSDKTAYKWKSLHEKKRRPVKKQTAPNPQIFTEVKVDEGVPVTETITSPIVFKRVGTELVLPANYPVDDLVRLIKALDR